jgi:hypothetical protein
VLKGDLAASPIEAVLTGLADEQATGCLHVSDPDGEEALVFFKNGLVYSVSVPGRRPQLGARLISSGALAPEGLADALEAQRDELQGWRLGELLVHLGYVEREVVEAFVSESVQDAMTDLVKWRQGRWRFRKAERTREDVAPPATVADLLAHVMDRQQQWDAISETVHGPNAVPLLSTRSASSAETTLDPDAWSLLCKVDGERSIAELARDCGFTLLEAGHVVVSLVQAGLVDVEEDFTTPPSAPAPNPAEDRDPADVALSLAAAFRTPEPPAPDEDLPAASAADELAELAASEEPVMPALSFAHHDDFADSIARVSAALSELLGPQSATNTEDLFALPAHARVGAGSVVVEEAPVPTPEDEERERGRQAAAAELAEAHAWAEEQRRLAEERGEDHVAPVVQLARKRRSARKAEAEALKAQAEREAEEARLAAEQEAARLAAEQEAARLAAEQEAARLAAEQEAARLAAEQEAARLAAEQEAARLAAEQEAARLAAEEEAARLAAEEEAARLAAEEKAARLAAEEEAARLAAEEEAARWAAEHEEAARLAAEQEEAARLAAEQEEAARLAAEQEEAARLAAEEEATRLAAEEEAARWAAAEEEAARLAAEEEAEGERLAAVADEAARIAASTLTDLTSQAIETPKSEPEVDDAEPEAEPSNDDDFFGSAVPDQRSGLRYDEGLDTASLLRELSSLGMEEEAPPQPPPPAPARPASQRPAAQKSAPAKPAAKKRKGLFGR